MKEIIYEQTWSNSPESLESLCIILWIDSSKISRQRVLKKKIIETLSKLPSKIEEQLF